MNDSKFIQGVMTINQLQHPEKYVGKQKMNIVYRSSWEHRIIRYLDRTTAVLEWSSEEHVVRYISPLDSVPHRYFPDFYVKIKNFKDEIKEYLWEIKPSHEAQDKPYITEGMSHKSKMRAVTTFAVNQAKWNSARAYCAKRNMTFLVLTEKDIDFHEDH